VGGVCGAAEGSSTASITVSRGSVSGSAAGAPVTACGTLTTLGAVTVNEEGAVCGSTVSEAGSEARSEAMAAVAPTAAITAEVVASSAPVTPCCVELGTAVAPPLTEAGRGGSGGTG